MCRAPVLSTPGSASWQTFEAVLLMPRWASYCATVADRAASLTTHLLWEPGHMTTTVATSAVEALIHAYAEDVFALLGLHERQGPFYVSLFLPGALQWR